MKEWPQSTRLEDRPPEPGIAFPDCRRGARLLAEPDRQIVVVTNANAVADIGIESIDPDWIHAERFLL